MSREIVARSTREIAGGEGKTTIRRRDVAIESLKDLMVSKEDKANAIIEGIVDAASTAGVAEELVEGSRKATRYVVNMTKETKEAIDKGLIKLDRGKDGQLYAQVRGADGRYDTKFSISEELVNQGIDTLDAVNALQLKAIQAQLMEMAETIDAIGQDVEGVLQGQQNDRLGLYYAGESLFLEAQSVQDPTFKKILSSQALKSLSDASAQLSQQMQSDVRYLVEGRYKGKKGRQSEEIASRMESINKSFEVIHKAALLKAAVYYEADEIPAMLAVISDYGRFLEGVVEPNSRQLAEFDRKDNLLRGGVWERRSRSLSSVAKIQGQLKSATTFCLEAPSEEDETDEG